MKKKGKEETGDKINNITEPDNEANERLCDATVDGQERKCEPW